jgi:hypothetical protein
MASIVVCGNPDPFAQTESRDCVSARPASSANATVSKNSPATSAKTTRRHVREFESEIRSSESVRIVHRAVHERAPGQSPDHRVSVQARGLGAAKKRTGILE